MSENEDRERKLKNFKAWFLQKWSAWDDQVGNRTTQLELANHLGITRASVAAYRLGNQLPEGENLQKIAEKMGVDIYDVLEMPRPNLNWEDLEQRFNSAMAEVTILIYEKHLVLDSDEWKKVVGDIATKWGLKKPM